MTGEVRVLRSWIWNIVAAVILLAVAAVCAGGGYSGFAGDQDEAAGPAIVLMFGVGFVVLVAAAVRVLIVGVIVTADGLVVRELLSTKRLPWATLRRADVRRSDGVRLELYGPRMARVLHNPTIHYVPRGEKVPRLVTVTALGTYRLAVAEQRAEAINDLIRRHSGRA